MTLSFEFFSYILSSSLRKIFFKLIKFTKPYAAKETSYEKATCSCITYWNI